MGKLHKLAYRVISTYWKIVFPTTVGIRCIITNHKGQVLLVRHSYRSGWYLPGGKLEKRETFEQGIRRELQEELGISPETFTLFGAYNNFYEKNDSILLFETQWEEIPKISSGEIQEAGFFDFDHLPSPVSPGTMRRLTEWQQANNPAEVPEKKPPFVGMW